MDPLQHPRGRRCAAGNATRPEAGRSAPVRRARAGTGGARALVAGFADAGVAAPGRWVPPEPADCRNDRERRVRVGATRDRLHARTKSDGVHVRRQRAAVSPDQRMWAHIAWRHEMPLLLLAAIFAASEEISGTIAARRHRIAGP